MVPQFQDKDIDSYFITFEHTGNTLGWPKDQWPILLSTVLRGKAQVAYAAMDPLERCDYDKVKLAIQTAFELVPEAYRQQFRVLHKTENQTHVEFLRDKERQFNKWCNSRNVDTFDSLKNLVLLEDFKDNVQKGVKVHLDDLDITDVHTAARKADDYAITHRLSNQSANNFSGKGGKAQNNDKSGHNARGPGQTGQKQGPGSDPRGHNSGKWCEFHRVRSHNTDQCYHLKGQQGHAVMQSQTQSPVATASYKGNKEKPYNRDAKKQTTGTQAQTNPVALTVTKRTDYGRMHSPMTIDSKDRSMTETANTKHVSNNESIDGIVQPGKLSMDSNNEMSNVVSESEHRSHEGEL